MQMNKSHVWKNFNLGTELEVAGSFIYNGLKILDNMENFCYEEESFEFLYNISVGVERLQKIVIILTEHNDTVVQEEFEKSLITHNHMDLMKRISSKYKMNFASPHNAFIQLLAMFYKTCRYDRYILDEAFYYDKERVALVDFIKNHLKIDIKYQEMFEITENSTRIKRFLGKIIGKICNDLYELVCEGARSQNTFTYEIRHNSKACKIFLRKEYDFINENIVWKEMLLFFMNCKEKSAMLDLMKETNPLNFEPLLVNEYINCFKSDSIRTDLVDLVETLYEEMEDKGERLQFLDVLDNPHMLWDVDEYVDEDEDEDGNEYENDEGENRQAGR